MSTCARSTAPKSDSQTGRKRLIGLFPNELQIPAGNSSAPNAPEPHSIFRVSASGFQHEANDLTLALTEGTGITNMLRKPVRQQQLQGRLQRCRCGTQ